MVRLIPVLGFFCRFSNLQRVNKSYISITNNWHMQISHIYTPTAIPYQHEISYWFKLILFHFHSQVPFRGHEQGNRKKSCSICFISLVVRTHTKFSIKNEIDFVIESQ